MIKNKILNVFLIGLIAIIIVLGHREKSIYALKDYFNTYEFLELPILLEKEDEIIIYFSINNNEFINDFESKMVNEILKKENFDYETIIYIDLGDNESYGIDIEEFEETYNNGDKIEMPTIVHMKNEKIVDIKCILCNNEKVEDILQYIILKMEDYNE